MRLFIYGLSAADKIDNIFSNNIHCAMYLFHHKIITSTEKLKQKIKSSDCQQKVETIAIVFYLLFFLSNAASTNPKNKGCGLLGLLFNSG